MTNVDIDQERLERIIGQLVTDMGAGVSCALTRIGHRLGLYETLAGDGPLTPGDLAERTGTNSRHVREWLNSQAAGGYVSYDPSAGTYAMTPEQALVLADEDSPVHMAAAFDLVAAVWAVTGDLEAIFRHGDGLGWHEQDGAMFAGTEAFFGAQYRAHLVPEWIPALTGVEDRLSSGVRVADVGCGHGAATILLAQAYPHSTLVGFDYHEASIEVARKRAAEAGVEDRVVFEVASALDLSGRGYDLVCFFDALHDMGDPVGAAIQARKALADNGTVLLVEPNAADRVEDNFNPIGRLGYGMSTAVCTPNALAQGGRLVLGAQAGEEALRGVMAQAGFSRFRRAAETPVHLVLEARP